MSVPPTIQLDLPALTPAEADLLWHFVQDLEAKLWDAYAPQLIDQAQRDLFAPDLPDITDPSRPDGSPDF